ncbi:TetR/AcrR family transcriptional regulator [Sandaracinobacteroides saxicola]|uniref:TetR/AcrR family transcriptional regulator n=1 Tax=Sandaracinobacteroides saxicola TaxID=2759707 RepID=A0A7G5IGW3_9SPHN|nr:TetR/AcrR family transcriptional regulator [Sandaracinobacteroides saxicola]QMW22605.1 TetR/AcrR family transcriptional regulator [Sandaracinobacteroides saxicola]
MASKASDARARRYDPTETRQRVVEAAYQLFATRGYAQTGTADIAREADVSEGSIFYHFGSKRALLAELGRLHGEKMVAAMQGDDAIEDLEPGINIRRCFAFCVENETWERMAEAGAPCPSGSGKGHKNHNPEAEPFFNAAREVTQRWVTEQLVRSFAKRGITGIDPEIAASLTFTVVGDALQMAFGDPATPPERIAFIQEQCVRFVRAACGYPADLD